MQAYSAGGAAGTASATAATAGLIKIDNPGSGDLSVAQISSFFVGPQSNSEDSTYSIQLKGQTTAGTWTSVTARASDPRCTVAAVTTCARASTAAGTAGNIIGGPWGFHHNGGIRIVFEPEARPCLTATASNGLIIEYVTVQGTAINAACITFLE